VHQSKPSPSNQQPVPHPRVRVDIRELVKHARRTDTLQ
jgi:hypothetical protein